MPHFDLPLDQLRTYSPAVVEPADFDAFWERTLADARSHALAARFDAVGAAIYKLVDVFDLVFAGFDGQPVRGWLIQPAGARRPLPAVVSYIGYGGGRSLPIEHLAPAVAGLIHVVMDSRGQGAGWSPGDTPDAGATGPHTPGFMTAGIESPETYYYRRLITDAVRAVEAAAAWPQVDAARIAVRGASQGGGLAIAAGGLLRERVKLVLADVPFLCFFRRAVGLIDKPPYNEITRYLSVQRRRAEQTFATLSYFDGVNFAKRITARTHMSAGLMDQVCPPSTVFAAYNQVRGPKEMRVYEFNEHEGGGVHQLEAWVGEVVAGL